MAKRRRRGKFKTRPVKPQSEAGATNDPSLQSQQVDNAAPMADTPAAPVAPATPATGIPSTGMPIAAALEQQLPPTDNSIPEDQGYARGGLIPAPMPGYSDYTAMRTDPVARRRYSPRHVAFAKGGEVDKQNGYVDAMDYLPDPMAQPQQQPQNRFDEFNMIGREDPRVNPMLAGGMGYARGGSVAVPVPAYTTPVTPPPSEANAKLYSDIAALRERTVNPPPLQMPALPNLPYSAPAPAAAPAAASPSYQGPVPQTGGVMGAPGWDQAYRQATASTGDPFDQIWNRTLQRYSGGTQGSATQFNPSGFAQGGAIPAGGAAPADTEGYLRGDNAMPPEQLDAVLQQIAQLDPNKGEDAVNLTAIVQAAQSGNMDQAASILAGFRRRFDSLNAHAQGAAAHGNMEVAARLAGKAHSQVPDGRTVTYVVAPDGSVMATVAPSGQTFQLSAAQFHDYLVGPATSFDHILENGLEKNLAIASGGRGGQQAPGANPAPTGYAIGGDVAQADSVRAQIASDRDQSDEYQQAKAAFWNKARGMPRYAAGGWVGGGGDIGGGRGIGNVVWHKQDPRDMEEMSQWDLDATAADIGRAAGRAAGGPVTRGYQEGGEVKDEELRSDWQRPPNFQDRMMDAVSTVVRRPPAPRGSLPDQLGYNAIPERGYQEGGTVDDDRETRAAEEARRAADEAAARQRENESPYYGGRRAVERVGLPEEPAGGQTALRFPPQLNTEAIKSVLDHTRRIFGFGDEAQSERVLTGRGTTVARETATEPAAPAEPRMGARPIPGPASARRGVEYPEPLPGEGLGGSTVSARRVGTPAAAAAPEPQQLGSREDISLPPAAQPTAAAPPGSNQAAYDAAAARGDVYTTQPWSVDRLTKEAIPDIMQGKLFGRKNVVDYPERPAVAETRPAVDTSPVDVEQRRADYIRDRSAQQQPSARSAQPAAVEPHEQRMREIDAQQEQLRQPVAPAGSGISEPKAYEGKRGVDRYNKEIAADQHRYTNEVNQRAATITDQHRQDDTIIRAYNNAKKDGTDTPELKRAYETSMYRMSGGKLAIPREEAPAVKQEQPGIIQRIFGTGASAQPAAQGTYGSPGWPPRAPSPGKRWGQDARGQFVEY